MTTLNPQQLQLFRRSTRLERDCTSAGLQGYIPTPRGLELLAQLLDSLASSDYKAFSITGPYGSGKSSFAVFLSAVFESSLSEAHQMALRLLEQESPELVHSIQVMRERLGVVNTGFVVVKVTAQRAPLLQILRDALLAAIQDFDDDHPVKAKVIYTLSGPSVREQELVSVVKSVCATRPLLICIDEFGKTLEWFSDNRSRDGDLYILQQLIEQSETQQSKPFALVTLQHLAFDDYAADTAALRQREWAKIQGRFRDFPFSDSSQTTGFLMARCLEHFHAERPANAEQIWKEAKGFNILDRLILQVKKLAPLHPLTAVLLPELCSKYGQHERSLFKFLGSHDEGSLQWLIENNCLTHGWVMPWHLYDYFLASAGSTSALPSLAQRWIEIQTRLRDAVGLTAFELQILKTIGLFNLCASSGVVRANQKLLAWVLGSLAPEAYSLEVAIEQLQASGFITYRDQVDEFRIWRGSDFDLGQQVRLIMASYRQDPLDQLMASTLLLEPLIATRHSQQRCVVRLFQQCFASNRSDLTSLKPVFSDPDGLLIWWLSDQPAVDLALPDWASTAVLVSIERPSDLRPLVSYVHAYQTLLNGMVIPEQDWVARREAQERLAGSLQKLLENVNPLLQITPRSQVQMLQPLNVDLPTAAYRSSASLLSAICDVVYSQTPRIPNEMLSRRELTSQGAKARRLLIEAMAEHPLDPSCGMSKGYGPERAMFDALVAFHGMQHAGDGLAFPHGNSDLVATYRLIDQFFRDAKDQKRKLSELWSALKAPPFGLKDGPIPVLVAHYLLLHDDQVGLYEDGRFLSSVDTAVIERLAKNPETFHCSSFSLDGLRKTYVSRLMCGLQIDCAGEMTMLYAVKQLLRIVRRWTSHARHTQELSPPARALRKAFLGAMEPDQLLFVDLPKAVGCQGIKEAGLDALVDQLRTAFQEVDRCFDVLLEQLKSSVGQALNVNCIGVRGDVAPRAARLKNQILDPKLRAFALALADEELEGDDDWIQRVGLSLLGRAPSEWIDADVQRFYVALNELAPAFRRLEALHFTQQGDGQTGFKAIRLGLTTSDGADHQQVISVPESKAQALQAFVDRMASEAVLAFGEQGGQLVLAQWAQQVMLKSGSELDELSAQRQDTKAERTSHLG
ncbi:hypothetical protein ICNINCKA_01803 [Synechococcus sp. CBW1107]|nr:hypothetical protein ICNINCKA_01803 [Synechococcus sp. CBW1107]